MERKGNKRRGTSQESLVSAPLGWCWACIILSCRQPILLVFLWYVFKKIMIWRLLVHLKAVSVVERKYIEFLTARAVVCSPNAFASSRWRTQSFVQSRWCRSPSSAMLLAMKTKIALNLFLFPSPVPDLRLHPRTKKKNKSSRILTISGLMERHKGTQEHGSCGIHVWVIQYLYYKTLHHSVYITSSTIHLVPWPRGSFFVVIIFRDGSFLMKVLSLSLRWFQIWQNKDLCIQLFVYLIYFLIHSSWEKAIREEY